MILLFFRLKLNAVVSSSLLLLRRYVTDDLHVIFNCEPVLNLIHFKEK